MEEAITKRKAEGFKSKKTCGTCWSEIPTMISFERAETTISIEKVLAILEIVGMVAKLKPTTDKLDNFVMAANSRWFELTKTLPKDSAARHHFGYSTHAFRIDGPLKTMDNINFYGLLQKVAGDKYSGWPPFWVPAREELQPYIVDNNIECWLGKESSDRIFFDASTTDYWRASKLGFMYLQRGYK